MWDFGPFPSMYARDEPPRKRRFLGDLARKNNEKITIQNCWDGWLVKYDGDQVIACRTRQQLHHTVEVFANPRHNPKKERGKFRGKYPGPDNAGPLVEDEEPEQDPYRDLAEEAISILRGCRQGFPPNYPMADVTDAILEKARRIL